MREREQKRSGLGIDGGICELVEPERHKGAQPRDGSRIEFLGTGNA